MSGKSILFLIYVLFVPFAARLLPDYQVPIVTAHEFLSSLIVAIVFFGGPTKDRVTRIFFGGAFLALALADLVYGFTGGELVLDTRSLIPSVIARELSYALFAACFATALARLYAPFLRAPGTLLALACLIVAFTGVAFRNVLAPLAALPDRALLFVASGGIYAVARAFILALAIQKMAFERNLTRFLFLYALAQMFICEMAFTFQPNVVDAVKTPLNSWLETGWEISTAAFCAIAFLRRGDAFVFGDHSPAHWKSVRSLTVALVMGVLVAQGAWFWFFGSFSFTNMSAVTQLISLGFFSWVLANAAGIAVSSQISRVALLPERSVPRPPAGAFTLEENQRALEHVLALQRRLEEQRWLAKIGEFSAQIAHDIRSPLSALNFVAASLPSLEDDRRALIRSAVVRINDIANQLLKKDQIGDGAPEPLLLAPILETVLREKREQLRGIPAEVLGRLGQLGVSYGKSGTASGSGLGLYHARTTIERLGGKLAIRSLPGSGTSVIITLPRDGVSDIRPTATDEAQA